MTDPQSSGAARQQRFQDALAAILQRLEGEPAADLQVLLVGTPADLRKELEEFFRNRSFLDRVDPRQTPAPLEAVRYFGDYELLQEIARGGMGVVYKGWQKSLNRIVALKMILAGQLAAPADVQRFRTEAENAASLDHPHIVPIYEVGEHEGQHFFSMKFIEGGSLASQRRGDPRAAARLVATVARAVHFAHQGGILHRDLKPHNILLDADGLPHVTDFGLARRITGSGGQTLSGAVVGTPSYVSPEQASGQGKRLTTAADVYGLGAVLYECLTGAPPFRAATPLETLMQVVHQEPTPPSRLNPGVPRDLEIICLKCLSKDPSRRYASAEALAEDLERFLNGEPIAARPAGMAERAWRWCQRNRAVAALLGTVALTLLLGSLVSGFFAWRASVNEAKAQEKADDARTEAEERKKQWQRAEQEKAEKEQQRQLAVKERQEARLRLLNSQLYRVEMVYRSDPTKAWRLLHDTTACPPDLRDFTWGLYNRWCQPIRSTMQGHRNGITCVVFSPDGKTLVSGSKDRTVGLWDVPSGQQRATLQGHTHDVTAVAFSPDGKTLASASKDRTIKLWDAPTGKERATLKGHTDSVRSVAFSPDGKTLASAGGEKPGEIKLWDAVHGQERVSLPGHTGGVLCVVFSPDGQTLASASQDKTIKLWDLKTDQVRATLKEDKGPVESLAFSPDGKTLASGCQGGTVKLWDSASGQERASLAGPVSSLAFSPDGNTLAAAGGEIKLWDVKTGQERATLRGHAGSITCVTFSPDGKTLASGNTYHTIELWEPQECDAGLSGLGDLTLVISPDGKTVAGRMKDEVKLWDARTGQERATFKGQDKVNCVAFSPDGKTLVGGGSRIYWAAGPREGGGWIKWWDVPSGQERLAREVSGHPVHVLVFSPDGKTLASGSHDYPPSGEPPGEVLLWDAVTGKQRATLKGHRTGILSVAFSPDSKTVASTSGTWNGLNTVSRYEDGVIKLWYATTGKERATIKGETFKLSTASFSPDSKALAANNADGMLTLWDTATGKARATLDGYGRDAIFSPDGKTIVARGGDMVRWWDVATGQRRSSSTADRGGGLAYSPDGKTLASLGSGTIQLWDGATGQERATFKGLPAATALVFSPDGQTLAALGEGTIKRWQAQRAQHRDTINAHGSSAHALAFSPDGKTLAAANGYRGLWDAFSLVAHGTIIYPGGNPYTITLWDAVTGKDCLNFQEEAVCLCFSPDGKSMAVVNEDGGVNLWDIATGQKRDIRQRRRGYPTSVCFSPDGKTLAVGQDDVIELWDMATGQLRDALDGQPFKLRKEALAFWKDKLPEPVVAILAPLVGQEFPSLYAFNQALRQRVLGVFGHDPKSAPRLKKEELIELENVFRRDREIIPRRLGLSSIIQPFVFSVCFSPDGTLLASAHADPTVFTLTDERLTTLRKDGVPGAVVAKLTPLVGQEFISQATFLKALGQRLQREELALFQGFLLDLAQGSFPPANKSQPCPGEVKLWDVATGQVRAILKGHADFVSSVVFSPDGKTVASCGRDGQVKLWDIATRKERAVVKTLAESVAFSPDSKTLASGGADAAVRLWDAATGQEFACLKGHFGAVLSVAFSPDGKTVASGGMDGTIKFWDVPPSK